MDDFPYNHDYNDENMEILYLSAFYKATLLYHLLTFLSVCCSEAFHYVGVVEVKNEYETLLQKCCPCF